MFTNWLKSRGGGQTVNSSAENQENSKPRKLKKKKIGSILIEVAFTLPIVVYLMFFCIELIKINITKEALQSICEEITYLTIAHDYASGLELSHKGDAIVEKYRPSFIPKEAPGYKTTNHPVIRWHYETYESFSKMLQDEPYGGTTITYPGYEREKKEEEAHAYPSYQSGVMGPSQFIPANGKQCVAMNYTADRSTFSSNVNGSGLQDNTIFVITVTCNYPFSSGMVKMLFGGGINTKVYTMKENRVPESAANCPKGNMYLLWARGTGIVNPK